MPDIDDLKFAAFGHTQYGKQSWRRGEKIELQGDVDYWPARRTDPDTSQMAAAALDANPLESLVLETLREFGPATIEQVAERTGVEWKSISPRFRPLANKGLIRDSGKRVTSSHNRSVIVWESAIRGPAL